jgi:hypothetical protein
MDLAQPVFIIGSPRSGTSVLTWCLGQHPNLLPLQETNWIAKFAIDLLSSYEAGSNRGRLSHLSGCGISYDNFFAHFGASIDALVRRCPPPSVQNGPFCRRRSPSDPKERWVDGTPEYSFYVFGLKQLFPGARFIHLVRDVDSVVKSLMRFDNTGASSYNQMDAYQYWLRTSSAAFAAEMAFGSEIVRRVRYRDLLESPEIVLSECLAFLGEAFTSDCLEPLSIRINSSHVEADFVPREDDLNPSLLHEARTLSERLLHERQPNYEPNQQLLDELERSFVTRARFVASLDSERTMLLERVRCLEAELQDRAAVLQQ